MKRHRVYEANGDRGWDQMTDEVTDRLLDPYSPPHLFIIGGEESEESPEELVALSDTLKKKSRIENPPCFTFPPTKALDGGDVSFCLATAENALRLSDFINKGEQDETTGEWDPKPRSIDIVIVFYPADEQKKFLGLLLERTDVTVYIVPFLDPKKSGLVPVTEIEGYEGIPADVDLEAPQVEGQVLRPIPEDAMYGIAKVIAKMLRVPIGFAYLVVVVMLSVRVKSSASIRAALYGALVGDVGEGKTLAMVRAGQLLGLTDGDGNVTSHLCKKTTPVSDRGLTKLFPGPEAKPCVLLQDEMRSMMSKASIDNSTLASQQCGLWSQDQAGVIDKKGEEVCRVRLSILGNLKIENPSEFPKVFTHSTSHGLYDRFLLAVRGGEKWRWEAMGGAGGTIVNHFHVQGMISADNLKRVVRKINEGVKDRSLHLKSSDSFRVTRRSQ